MAKNPRQRTKKDLTPMALPTGKGRTTVLLTVEDVARMLKQCEKHVRKLMSTGQLQARKQGRRWFTTSEMLRDFINSCPTASVNMSPARADMLKSRYVGAKAAIKAGAIEFGQFDPQSVAKRNGLATCPVPPDIVFAGKLCHGGRPHDLWIKQAPDGGHTVYCRACGRIIEPNEIPTDVYHRLCGTWKRARVRQGRKKKT